VGWRGVTTTSYLDISTAFRSEPAERRARPKAELQPAFRSEPAERRARPKAELQRCHNEASAQKGPRFR
jgi:hypothetical protein